MLYRTCTCTVHLNIYEPGDDQSMAAKVRRIILLLLSFLLAHRAVAFRSQCVSSFENNEQRFDVCLTQPCFIFREEEPVSCCSFAVAPNFVLTVPKYIFLNNKMDEQPFRCARYKEKSSELHGAFFEIIGGMSTLANAHCVYAGRNCTFDGMISFINSSSAKSNHQWIGGGVLFVLQNRILSGVIPTTSLLEDYLHVVGPPSQKREPIGAAWDLVIKPFTWKAWMTVLAVLFLFLLVRVLMIYMFGNVARASGFLRSIILCSFQSDIRMRDRNVREDAREDDWYRLLDHHWKLAFLFFTAVILLLYEVALGKLCGYSSSSGGI